MTDMNTHFASHGDVRIQFLDEGVGPVIVLLPSLGRDAGDFDDVTRHLVAGGFRVVRPQPRTTHGSQGTLENLTLVDLAADIAAVLDLVGPAVVAGHAFGNFVARTLAAVRPELVTGVALLAASAGKTPDGSSPYDAGVIDAVRKSSDLSLDDAQRLQHLRLAFFAPQSDARVWLHGWYPELKLAQLQASDATPVDLWFAAGSSPVLHLQAEFDTVAPMRLSQFLRDCLGERVTTALIEGAGHALLPEQPQQVAQALMRWVRQLEQRV